MRSLISQYFHINTSYFLKSQVLKNYQVISCQVWFHSHNVFDMFGHSCPQIQAKGALSTLRRNHFCLFSSHPCPLSKAATEPSEPLLTYTTEYFANTLGPLPEPGQATLQVPLPEGDCGISVLTPRPRMWTRGSCLQRFAWGFHVLDEVFTLMPEATGNIRMEYGVKRQVRWADISPP